MHPVGKNLATPLMKSLVALLFASALGAALVAIRVIATHRLQYINLVGNLALAWIPLLASLLLDHWDARTSIPKWKRVAVCVVWFFFFPNAPYILTDLVHLGSKFRAHYWVDMLLILWFALTGLVIGFLSLRSMQRRVERRLNWPVSWLFVAVMSFLCGVGIFAGRFWRWNSWDVIARPGLIAGDLKEWMINPHPLSIVFPLLFAAFLFTSYLTLLAAASYEACANKQTSSTS